MAGFQGYIAPLSQPPIVGGSVTSGALADNSVLSGNIASGQLSTFKVASGGFGSGAIGSGVIGHTHLASGSVRSGHVASGQIGTNHFASGVVLSGTIASGQVGQYHLASGSVQGALGTTPVVASGTLGPNDLASGSVLSGAIASGQIGANHLASGTAAPANNSGTVVRAAQFTTPFQSGTSWSLNTEEVISGVRAVCVSQSGQLRVAMASVSGRMPAIGIVVDGVLSGIPANVYTQGVFSLSSGMADYSGCLGKPVWVGRSGQVVTWSGSFNSGGLNLASGADFIQRLGVAVGSGTFIANVVLDMGQTQLLGVTAITDVDNRSFGV